MFVHVVLMRFADSASAEEAEGQLRGLAGRIDVVRRLAVGRNIVPSDRAYDLAIIVELDSREAFDAYEAHPEHQAVGAVIRRKRTAAVSCDFEA